MTHDEDDTTPAADSAAESDPAVRRMDSETAAAFGAVGNEHRVAILRALMNAYQAGETPLAYSALMDQIEMRDSGQFNYHLQQLVGRFVSESPDGYALTYAGRTVVSAIASGTLDESVSLEPEPVAGTCYACGEASLVIHYPGQRVRVTCRSCDEEVVHIQFPPAAVAERTVSELKRDFDTWARSWRSLVGTGICPECSGRISGELRRTADVPTAPTTGAVDVRAAVSCEQCWVRGFMPPGVLVVDHPAVVSFFWQQGVDTRERPLWQHGWALTDDNVTVTAENPLSVDIDVPGDGTSLTVRVGNSLEVESVIQRWNG